MIKNLLLIFASSLLGATITQHFADKKIIDLHRHYDKEEHLIAELGYTKGFEDGAAYGIAKQRHDSVATAVLN